VAAAENASMWGVGWEAKVEDDNKFDGDKCHRKTNNQSLCGLKVAMG
jgi:hypothetical protein